VLDGEDDLAGLSGFRARSGARRRPNSAGLPASTSSPSCARASNPSCNSPRDAICARRCSAAWIARGDGGGPTDNKAIIAEMVALRAERARLLG